MEPRSRAAARRNDLDADQRQPTIKRRGREPTTSAKPCQRSSGNATHASFNHRGTIAGSVCVATTGRIRRTASGTISGHRSGSRRTAIAELLDAQGPLRERAVATTKDVRCGDVVSRRSR